MLEQSYSFANRSGPWYRIGVCSPIYLGELADRGNFMDYAGKLTPRWL